MRDIKFRAWNKKENIIVYDNEDDTYGYWDGCCNSNVGMVNTILNSKYYEQYDFMQYTGLHDKNEKEIYEGDIVYVVSEDENAFIVWDEETTRYIIQFNGWCADFDNYYGKELEVIGNVYENLDLLEKEVD